MFESLKEIEDECDKSDEHFINLKINDIYMLKNKKNVALSHNMIAINNQLFIFDRNYLIIVDERDIEQNQIKLLKLFDYESLFYEIRL